MVASRVHAWSIKAINGNYRADYLSSLYTTLQTLYRTPRILAPTSVSSFPAPNRAGYSCIARGDFRSANMASCLRLTRISTAGIPTAADIPAFDCLPPSIESPNSPSTADSTGTTSSDSEPGQSPVLLRALAKLRLDRQSKPADRPRPTRGYDEDDSAPDFDGNYLFTGYSTNSSSESPSPAHSPAAEQSDSIAQKNKGAIFFFRSLTGELRPEVRLLTAKVCQRPVLKRGQSDKASAASLRFDSAYPSTSASDSEREDGRKRTCGRRVRFSDQESEFEQSTSTKERTGQVSFALVI